MMEIRTLTNSAPLAGIRPAADGALMFQQGRDAEQVTAAAVRQPAEAESSAAGRKAADPEPPVFRSAENGQPPDAGSAAALARTREAIDSIAVSLQSLSKSSGLRFAIDDELGRIVVKVVDPETQEVIKQFPSEDAIELARTLRELGGNLIREKA